MKCPTCSSNLVLRQINLNTATYLCEIKTCSYPEGHGWIFVATSLDNTFNQSHQAPDLNETEKDTTDNMEWLDNICNEGVKNLQSNSDTTQSDQLSAIYDEILKELDLSNCNVTSNVVNQTESATFDEFDMPLLNLF